MLCFDVQSSARIVDHSFKAHKALCTTYDECWDLLVGSYGDSKVRLFNEKGIKIDSFQVLIYSMKWMCIQLHTLVCIYQNYWILSFLEPHKEVLEHIYGLSPTFK